MLLCGSYTYPKGPCVTLSTVAGSSLYNSGWVQGGRYTAYNRTTVSRFGIFETLLRSTLSSPPRFYGFPGGLYTQKSIDREGVLRTKRQEEVLRVKGKRSWCFHLSNHIGESKENRPALNPFRVSTSQPSKCGKFLHKSNLADAPCQNESPPFFLFSFQG